MKRVWNFLREQDGLETVEYAIITGLIVAGTVGLITALGTWVYNQFNNVNTELGA